MRRDNAAGQERGIWEVEFGWTVELRRRQAQYEQPLRLGRTIEFELRRRQAHHEQPLERERPQQLRQAQRFKHWPRQLESKQLRSQPVET
jgi:hypothetical protein